MSDPEDRYGPMLEVYRQNPGRAAEIREQHKPDDSGRCRLCRSIGCTTFALVDQVLKERKTDRL